MNPKLHPASRPQVCAGLAALLLVAFPSAFATDIYWDGGTNIAWGANTNWSTSPTGTTPDPTTAPGASDTIYYNISTVNTPVVTALNSARSVAGVVFNSTGTVELRSHLSANTSFAFTIGAGGLTVNSGAGAVTTVSNGTNGFLTWRLNASQSWLNHSSNVMTIGGAITNNADTAPYTLTMGGTGSGGIAHAGAISNGGTTGTTAIVIDSSAFVTLSGTSTYSGGTTLTAGTLRIGNASAIGTGTLAINGGTLDTNNATARTLSTNNAQTWGGNFAFTGTGDLNLGTGAVTLSGGSRTITANAGTLTVGGAIGDSGNGYGLTKAGAGVLVLSGAHTYSGATTVSAGTLRGSIGAGNLEVASGATYELNGANRTAGALSGGGTIALGANTLTTSTSGSSTFDGTFTGAGSLIKSGGGVLNLTNTATIAGGTTVTAGGLRVNGALTSSVTVEDGASLSGSGTIVGAVSISGSHNPGNSPGVQTIDGNLTYNSGANVGWELTGNTVAQGTGTLADPFTFDQIAVTGTLNFAGATTLTLSFNSAGSNVEWSDAFWSSNRSWQIYSSAAVTNFSNLELVLSDWQDSQGALFSALRPGATFGIQTSGGNVYLNYAAIPEPSTYAALAGAAALLRALVQRRRKSVRAAALS